MDVNCDDVCQESDEPLEGSYFVSTYPPFSSWSEGELAGYRSALARPPESSATPGPPRALGLYVHVPFCAERCRYCYYMSHADPGAEHVDQYLDSILRELDSQARSAALAGRELSFVYVGGGTPSMLSAANMQRLLAGIEQRFVLQAGAEVSFECAPQSALADKLKVLVDGGVTRLSMGVQSLDDEVLRLNGRIHSARSVEQAYERIASVGFDIVNLDLIVGLVGESEESFFATLERIIGLGPDSVTLYQLEVPLNTPLYRALEKGEVAATLPTWETKRERLGRAFEALEGHGYCVRSAYCAVRDPARHRFVYQEAQYHGADVLGIGPSAFSYIAGVHHQNVVSLRAYNDCLERGELPLGRAHELSETEQIVREFVLQLKLGGARTAHFKERFGIDVRAFFAEPLARCQEAGWLESDADEVRVTRAGLLRIDRLIPDFYLEQHRNIRYS